jgi:hypothetical protein
LSNKIYAEFTRNPQNLVRPTLLLTSPAPTWAVTKILAKSGLVLRRCGLHIEPARFALRGVASVPQAMAQIIATGRIRLHRICPSLACPHSAAAPAA